MINIISAIGALVIFGTFLGSSNRLMVGNTQVAEQNEYYISADRDTAGIKPGSVARLIYHIDLYRMRSLAEAIAAGVNECISSGEYCFIEWPELIEPLLPENAVKILINPEGYIRKLTIFT